VFTVLHADELTPASRILHAFRGLPHAIPATARQRQVDDGLKSWVTIPLLGAYR
jgi:hypothetical protein